MESLEIRKEMVHMHNEYLSKLNIAMQTQNYIEASWICYSIFEQRTTRVIEKFIMKCPLKKRQNKKPETASISTRLKCIKDLSKSNYLFLEEIDTKLLENILKWCNTRNSLVHDLVSLERYKKFDEEFKQLAIEGNELVFKYYKQIENFRIKYKNNAKEITNMPCVLCQGNKRTKQKCILENG